MKSPVNTGPTAIRPFTTLVAIPRLGSDGTFLCSPSLRIPCGITVLLSGLIFIAQTRLTCLERSGLKRMDGDVFAGILGFIYSSWPVLYRMVEDRQFDFTLVLRDRATYHHRGLNL